MIEWYVDDKYKSKKNHPWTVWKYNVQIWRQEKTNMNLEFTKAYPLMLCYALAEYLDTWIFARTL